MGRKLLVTGASGNLGRRVVELLLEAGEDDVVAGTRTPERLADLAARGVEVREVDFDGPDLAASFRGVDRLLVVSTDALDRAGRRAEQHARAVAAAATAGVGHVVYTSLVNAVEGSAMTLASDHRATEEALRRSSLGYTILRNNLYGDLLEGAFAQAAATGQLYTARGDGAIAYVTREDCARAAAAALASSFGDRRVLDVTGPTALTGDELAALATDTVGRPVVHVPIPAEALHAALTGAGLPAGLVDALVSFDVAASRGELAAVSDGFERLTGRPPAHPRALFALAEV